MKTWMCAMLMTMAVGASAQNPIISGQYSADPTGLSSTLNNVLPRHQGSSLLCDKRLYLRN